ncbi:MAG: hypothetical protein K2L31_11115 [Muribaculum sp.]|nr:hypothetical protein [Muribaculum sp.]MDE6459129.1 hypothetical protein [Muribaculum sp.]
MLICTLSGCIKNTDDRLWSQIAIADSLMFIHPDSSLKIISNIDGIDNSDDATKAYYHLISTQAKSRNNNLEAGDSSILQSVNYYSRNKNDICKLAWSLVYASEVSSIARNDSLALKYIREAAKISEEAELKDLRLKTFIYNFWGNILYGKQPYHDAIDKYLIAEKYAHSNNDTTRIITTLMSVGEMYLWNHEYEIGRNYLERAINFINIYPNEIKRLPRIYERISTSYRMEGDNEKALPWITKSINSAIEQNYTSPWYLSVSKAEILTELGRLDSVAYYLDAAERGKVTQCNANQALFELTRAKYEAQRGDYKAAYETHRKYSAFLDSMYKENEQNRVAEFQRRYDYQDVAIERDRVKIESQAKNIKWLSITVALLALLLAALSYAYIQRHRRIKEDKAREKNINNAVNSVEERMRRELLHRDRHIENLRNRVIMMDDSLDKIRALRDAAPKERATSGSRFMMTDAEMEHLLTTVNICHEGFVDGLREEFPTLSDKDVEICALIKLGLQSRDIALLTGMSDNTLKTRKKRMKKEKFSEETADMQLDEWIYSKNYGKPTDDY